MAVGLYAETISVLRLVPWNGTESEVPLSDLRKVVFTQDSVVLIAAKDGAETPIYKYDYQSMLFAETESPTAIEEVKAEGPGVTGDGLQVTGEKFIRDGRLYIRRDGQVYDIMGGRLKIEN